MGPKRFFALASIVAGLAALESKGHTSYHETIQVALGDFAFVGSISDDGGESPLREGNSLADQRHQIDETVRLNQAEWRAMVNRFLGGQHAYSKTAALVKTPFDKTNANSICVFLGLIAGELCFTGRVSIHANELLSQRFAVGFHRLNPGRGRRVPMSLRAAVQSEGGLPLTRMETLSFDLEATEVEAELVKARGAQYTKPERENVPFMLLLMGAQYDRALAEALDGYKGWMAAKGDALLHAKTKDLRNLYREQSAASYLTQQVRELLVSIPDGNLADMAAKVESALAAPALLTNSNLDYVRITIKGFRAELAKTKFER